MNHITGIERKTLKMKIPLSKAYISQTCMGDVTGVALMLVAINHKSFSCHNKTNIRSL